MLIIFGDSRLIRDAINRSFADADRDLPGQQEELGTVRARIRRLEDAKERYFRAFEEGSLSSALCSERITILNAELSELQGRASELEYAVDRTSRHVPTPQHIEAIRKSLRDAIESASPEISKRVFQALVHEVRVVSRDEIVPSYRVPLDEISQAPVLMLGGLATHSGRFENRCIRITVTGATSSGPWRVLGRVRRFESRWADLIGCCSNFASLRQALDGLAGASN